MSADLPDQVLASTFRGPAKALHQRAPNARIYFLFITSSTAAFTPLGLPISEQKNIPDPYRRQKFVRK